MALGAPLFLATALLAIAAPSADSEAGQQPEDSTPGYSCEEIRAGLEGIWEVNPEIPLTDPPEPVDDTLAKCSPTPARVLEGKTLLGLKGRDSNQTEERPELELGTVSGRQVAVQRDGPGGSGRYWEVAVAVKSGKRTIGACLITTTLGWRNVARYGNQFISWKALGGKGETARLVIMQSPPARGDATNSEFLLIPEVYRLDGDRLVVDRDATRNEAARYAGAYERLSQIRDNPFAKLHDAAAAAYRAFSKSTACVARPTSPKDP